MRAEHWQTQRFVSAYHCQLSSASVIIGFAHRFYSDETQPECSGKEVRWQNGLNHEATFRLHPVESNKSHSGAA